MAGPKTKPSVKREKPQRAPIYAYSEAPERIRALAFSDLAGVDEVTIFSSKKLPGLISRQLKRISLPGGEEAVTVEVKPASRVGVPVEAGIPSAAFSPDARARAILRGVEYAHADLGDAGGTYDLAEVRKVMHGISRQAVDKRVREGSLLAVPGPSNRRAYPTLQFNRDGTVVEGLKALHHALPTRNPWAVLNFLVNPQDRLSGAKPIERLRAGAVEDVVAAARTIGVQGAMGSYTPPKARKAPSQRPSCVSLAGNRFLTTCSPPRRACACAQRGL